MKVKPAGVVGYHQWDEASYDDEGNVVLPQGTIEWYVWSPQWDEDEEVWVRVFDNTLAGPFETEEEANQALNKISSPLRLVPREE